MNESVTDTIENVLRETVADYALGTESLHANWRCGYPDTYGPCNCVDEFVTSTAAVIAQRLEAK